MKRKLAAILAADMVGFSRLVELAEEQTIARQKDLRQRIFEPGIADAGGVVIKSTGDGFLAEFPSVVDAVRFAISAQKDVAASVADMPEDRRLIYRMGIHLGDIVVDDGDIYGDGVNLAARLEGIAPHGGICISSAVKDQIAGVVDAEFSDLGEQSLKNISRRIRAYAWGADPARKTPANPKKSSHSKPTVALGSFQGLGTDGNAQMLADACLNSVEGVLANLTGLDLVASDADPEHVATAVFQVSGTQARATIKLQDTRLSTTYLTSRLGADMSDPFEAEDSVSAEIATTIRYGILEHEAERAAQTGSDDPEAMLTLAAHYMMGSDIGEWGKARELLDRILEQQPDNFMAVTMKANTYIGEIVWGYLPISAEDAAEAEAGLRLGTKLNERSDYLHVIWAIYHYGVTGDLNAAIRSLERSAEINPNFAQSHMVRGWVHNLQGQPDLALERTRKAMFSLAKNRIYHRVHQSKAFSYLVKGEFDAAIDAADRALQHQPDLLIVLLLLASAAGQAGYADRCAQAKEALLRVRPEFRIGDVRRFAFQNTETWDQIVDGWRKAGLPE